MTFFFTLVFMFLVFLRPQEWLFPAMYGWPVLDVITIVALVTLLFDSAQAKSTIPKTPAVVLTAGLFLGALMSHAAHGYFQGMVDTIAPTFKICFFLFLLLIVTNSVERLRWVLFVFLVNACIMSVHAVLQDRTGSGYTGQPPYIFIHPDGSTITQSVFFGLFDDPNDLGQFLATCIPLAFAFPKRLNFISLILAAGVVWLLAEAMLATHSRGTLVGVIVSMAILVAMVLPVKWLPYVSVLGLIVGLVACALGGGAFLDQSARDRVVFWGYANQYFKSNFLFGGGYGMFADISGSNRPAHNAYVCCYTELGLFGYWFWFNLLTLGMIGCWRTRLAFRRAWRPEQIYLRRLAGLAISAMAGFAASAYFLSRAYVFPLFFLFGMLSAIPVIAQRYLPEEHPPLINFRKDVLFTGTVASLFSVVYIYISILLLNRAAG
jgi:hypothetical protein